MPPKKSSASKVQKTKVDSTASSIARFDRTRFVSGEASRIRGEQDEQAEEAESIRDEGGPSGQNLASIIDAIERGFHSMHQDSQQFQGWMTTVIREMATQTGVALERIPPWPPVHPNQMDCD